MSGDLLLPAVWSWDQKPEESTADFPPKFRAGTSPDFIDQFRVYLCGQPNYNQWHALFALDLFKNTSKVYILDLRAECRLYVNDQYVISHALPHPLSDICAVEELFAAQLSETDSVRLSSITKAPKVVAADGTPVERAITEELIDVKIDKVYTEKQAIENAFSVHNQNKNRELHYLRLPINNHDVPNPAVIDELIKFIMNIYQQDYVLLLHCEGGKGRSSLVLEMLKTLYSYKFGVKPLDNVDTTSAAKIGRHHSQEDIEQGRVSPSTRNRSLLLASFSRYSARHFLAGQLWTDIQTPRLEEGFSVAAVVDGTCEDATNGQQPAAAPKLGM